MEVVRKIEKFMQKVKPLYQTESGTTKENNRETK